MGKFAIFVVLAAYGIAACASEPSPSTGEWDADPLSWACREGKIECRSPGGFAVNGKAVRSSAVKVAAALTPISAETKDWATLGVALYDDDRNYWHLATTAGWPRTRTSSRSSAASRRARGNMARHTPSSSPQTPRASRARFATRLAQLSSPGASPFRIPARTDLWRR